MARPKKLRRVEFIPKETHFIPYGKFKCETDEIILNVEELESMRLRDIDKLTQEECAKKMNVSRQTFQNVLSSAREKVSKALVEGKSIRICGGYYTIKHCKFICLNCNNIYELKFDRDRYNCPICGSKNVICKKKTESCKNIVKRHIDKI